MTQNRLEDLDSVGPLYLVSGDRVLAEPMAMRLGEAVARKVGCGVEVHRRPAELGPLLSDLKTYSLFSPAKVLVAVETAVLADTNAAAELIDEALEACPVAADDEEALSERQRRSASRLLQTLRLFQVNPDAGDSATVVAQLPAWVLEGGRGAGRRHRRRGRRQVEEARGQLSELLDTARATGLQGRAETDLIELAEIAEGGLPEGHALILVESAVADEHPLVKRLDADGRFFAVGRVEAAKGGGWQGLELLATELKRETGIGITADALDELARRTIQRRESKGGAARGVVDADTTARFAAEYRKLANLVSEGEIAVQLVESVVEDRGEEDAWKTLDAIGAGRADEALRRIQRMLAGAEDPIAARLSFFALLAGFARQLSALSGFIDQAGVERRSMAYAAFKSQIAPKLQAELPSGSKNPLAGLHPYRLYRTYGVACRMAADQVADLPNRVLEAELRLKGDSGQPDAALTALVCDLAKAARSRG